MSKSAETEVEAQLDRIYAAPPEEFTEARNALAAELKRGGDAEGAARVRKLRKPTRPAWVVNRLALEQPAALDDLRAAARRLREVGAGDAGELREAAAAERKAVARLLELARGELRGAKGSGAALDRVGETLQAIAADESVEATAAAGRLEREQRVASIGGLGTLAAAPPKPGRARAKAKQKAKPTAAQRRARKAKLERAQAEVHKLRKQADSAERRAGKARERHERAEAAVAEALDTLHRAEADRADADAALAEAEQKLDRLAENAGGA